MLNMTANPFDGVQPNFSVFGAEFTEWWQLLLGGLWGIGFIIIAFMGIMAAVKVATARREGRTHDVAEGLSSLKNWGIGLLLLVGLPVIFGAFLALT